MSANRIAFVAPRLAADGAVGGAETLLLNLAQLARDAGRDVTLLTTCARDHVTWANTCPAGEIRHAGLRVIRFPVNEDRDIAAFLRVQEAISAGWAVSDAEEDLWLRESVNSRALEAHLGAAGAAYDRIVAGPYLFGLTEAVSRIAPDRTLLVPCLHDEPFARVRRMTALFGRVRGCLFNTIPERLLAERLFGPHLAHTTADRPPVAAVVGFALPDLPAPPDLNLLPPTVVRPYIAYCGRREPLKGTPLLVDYWAAFRRLTRQDLKLVLTGSGPIDVPEGLSADLIDLGYVDEAVKRAVMAGAVAFCHPSVNESLSIVLLEAWLTRTPALVHAAGVVLRHQCRAAQGGLWFRDYAEFAECLTLLLERPDLARTLGDNGRAFVRREYDPAAVQRRLLAALDA